MPFPEILRELREKKGFTQEQLAPALHLSKKSISHYEKGINSPNIDTLQTIADIFDVSVIPVQFSVLKNSFTQGTSIDDFLKMLLSLDNKHRIDLLKAMEYIKFHNDINLRKNNSHK